MFTWSSHHVSSLAAAINEQKYIRCTTLTQNKKALFCFTKYCNIGKKNWQKTAKKYLRGRHYVKHTDYSRSRRTTNNAGNSRGNEHAQSESIQAPTHVQP